MSRRIGVLYKLKPILPIKIRLSIFHSFVQSHINYCSLVWGFSCKSNIETIFSTQKKAMRAVMGGYVNYFYSEGQTPTHTKPAFVKHKILTIHSIIVKNALLLMYKIHRLPEILPPSIANLIHNSAPVPGSDYETCHSWLSVYNTATYCKSFFCKGPLLYTELADNMSRAAKNMTSTKTGLKNMLLTMQSTGDQELWQTENLKLYQIGGLRRSQRIREMT